MVQLLLHNQAGALLMLVISTKVNHDEFLLKEAKQSSIQALFSLYYLYHIQEVLLLQLTEQLSQIMLNQYVQLFQNYEAYHT